jgi:hypothetical protein
MWQRKPDPASSAYAPKASVFYSGRPGADRPAQGSTSLPRRLLSPNLYAAAAAA